MVWEPFAIAVVFGLVVSAGLYFIVMWPQVEPHDDHEEDEVVEATTSVPAATVTTSADPPITES